MTQISSKPINMNAEDIEKGKKLFAPRPGRRQTQCRSQPSRTFRKKTRKNRTGSRILIHRSQQGQRHHLGAGHSVRVLGEPEEIHFWHADGLRRTQEEEREGTADQASRV